MGKRLRTVLGLLVLGLAAFPSARAEDDDPAPSTVPVLDALPPLAGEAAFIFEGGVFRPPDPQAAATGRPEETCAGSVHLSARPVEVDGAPGWKLVFEFLAGFYEVEVAYVGARFDLRRAVVSTQDLNDAYETHVRRENGGYARAVLGNDRCEATSVSSPPLVPAHSALLALLGRALVPGEGTWTLDACPMGDLGRPDRVGTLVLRGEAPRTIRLGTEDVEARLFGVEAPPGFGRILFDCPRLAFDTVDGALRALGEPRTDTWRVRPCRGAALVPAVSRSPLQLASDFLRALREGRRVGASRGYLDVDALLDAVYGAGASSLPVIDREVLRDLYLDRLVTTIPELTLPARLGERARRGEARPSVTQVSLDGGRVEVRCRVDFTAGEPPWFLGIVVSSAWRVVDLRQGETLLSARLRADYEAGKARSEGRPIEHARAFLTGPDVTWGPLPELPDAGEDGATPGR